MLEGKKDIDMAIIDFSLPKVVLQFQMNKSEGAIRNFINNQLHGKIMTKVQQLETRVTNIQFKGSYKLDILENGNWQFYPKMSFQVDSNFTQEQIQEKFQNVYLVQLKDFIKSEIESNNGTIKVIYYKQITNDVSSSSKDVF